MASRRWPLLLALLVALAILGGAAWLLLRGGDPAGGAGPGLEPPASETLESATGPRDPADSTEGGAAADVPRTAVVRGILVLPRAAGRGPVEGRLTIFREGLPLTEAVAGPGAFTLSYERAADDPGPWRLRASSPGRSPVEVDLPSPVTDAGEIRLYEGLVYRGRVTGEHGFPQEGVTMHLLLDDDEVAASEPSSADGGFQIPIPPGIPIQGFFQEEDSPWGAPPFLEPRFPGRLFLRTHAIAEGLAGVHEVVLEERPVGIHLRFLEEATGQPVTGAAVSLWPSADTHAFAPPSPADSGTTDAEGIYAPRWPLRLRFALLRIAPPGGPVSWTMLDRSYAEGAEPRDLLLPREPRTLRAICLRGKGTEPVAGAFVVMITNAGASLWGTSDAEGGLSWSFFESDTFDPEPLVASGWTAAWRDGEDGFRVDAGGNAAAVDLSYCVDAPAPLPLRLGQSEAAGLWIAVRGEGIGTSARPTFVMVNPRGTDPAKSGFAMMFAGFRGPASSDARGVLWWAYGYGDMGTSFPGKPQDTAMDVLLQTLGGASVAAEATIGSISAARQSRDALPFDLRPAEVMTRSVRVVDAEGRPRPGALVAVIRDDQPKPWPGRETERLTADGDGRVLLQTLDPAGGCRVIAWDPKDGACGLLQEQGEAAKEAAWLIRVEPPREFRMALRMADGSEPRLAFVNLVPVSGMLPPVQVTFRAKEGGTASVPAVGIPGYTVYAYARDALNRSFTWSGPATDVAGGEVVLGAGTVSDTRSK